ncbi:MAG: ATP-binding protein [Candidatus Sumerlaeota bacterium]|nr:ATP-binding protein [Candidatus Sumerlaeota bacterium]
MIKRLKAMLEIRRALSRNRVTVLIGPRQCGKTTLARQFVAVESLNYFDLEDPASLARLNEPMTALRDLKGLVVIDEAQRRPDLFPILRVLADRKPLSARFLILGSANPRLLQQSSESLAGRIEILQLGGLSLADVGAKPYDRHWLRGAFPLAFLARTEADSLAWRKSFVQTFLERDLPQLDVKIPSIALLRFWTMIAHYHGQVWNGAEIARSLGVSEMTVRRYLDLLTDVFMIRQLQPWHENLNKRQVKAPKIYFRDTGLLHQLLGIRSMKELLSHPKCGASWEGYVIEETLKAAAPDEAYFWATHSGAELDLLIFKNGKRLGVECKRADAPRLTPSMRIALEDLKLDSLSVIYPGEQFYPMDKRINAIPAGALIESKLSAIFPH